MTLEIAAEAPVSLAVEPVISGFHPDPSVCLDGDGVYWLANSSFEYAPGVPIFRSTDLLRWDLVGNALTSDEQFLAGGAAASGGVYAPTLRHHEGRFWLITTDVRPAQRGQVLLSTVDPERGWSEPVLIEALRGIDPDLAWADGVCYVTYCSTDPDLPGIAQAAVDPATGDVLEEPRGLWSGTGLAFPEAPHLYRHDGWWYLMIAEGGTERGHAVSIARSRSITGPFDGAPSNPVFSHRSTAHPVQNTGHADLVQRTDGDWCAVYLGIRPQGRTPGYHVIGRETFLAGIEWRDGWPAFDEQRYVAARVDRGFRDDFSTAGLHPRWVSPGPRPADLALPSPHGGVELQPATGPAGASGLLATRVTDLRWRFEADVDARSAIALTLRLDDAHWCSIRLADRTASAVLQIGPLVGRLGELARVGAHTATLRICATDPDGDGPDDLELSVDGTILARFDGRYLSTEVASGFTGRVIGIGALRSGARLLEVRYRPDPPAVPE